jgi:hypothetical protein
MPCYIYGRPVRPADYLKSSQQGVATTGQNAAPSFSKQEKILENMDTIPAAEGEDHNE